MKRYILETKRVFVVDEGTTPVRMYNYPVRIDSVLSYVSILTISTEYQITLASVHRHDTIEMVVHSAATLVNYVSVPQVVGGSIVAAGLWSVKAWAGGRKCTWEREWAGKMILVVVGLSPQSRVKALAG
jgi:hypothetical protein